MRKLLTPILLVLILGLSSCCCNKKDSMLVSAGNNNYTGDYHQDIYVWGGAMNLAWTELKDSFFGEPIELETKDVNALFYQNRFNDPVFSRSDIDEASYYIKSGYGQETVDAINKECRAKFPSKSFSDLLIKLGAKDIISYAYFLKEVQYETQFEKQDFKFMNKPVQGFGANANSFQNVHVVYYENDDKFILALKLRDNSDQLFLAKGFPTSGPEEVVGFLRSKVPAQSGDVEVPGKLMNKKDVFAAPVLHLDAERKYEEMLGLRVKNKKMKGYAISVMQEKIKFDMDEKGARVENEAVIGMITSVAPGSYTPKKLVLDKPYWVIMKRANSNNPYFLMGVDETTVMKPL
ncbi:hypothetical protein MASR1M36_14280 [Candidatus Cloacimonadaceae bacterium]